MVLVDIFGARVRGTGYQPQRKTEWEFQTQSNGFAGPMGLKNTIAIVGFSFQSRKASTPNQACRTKVALYLLSFSLNYRLLPTPSRSQCGAWMWL